MVSITMSDEKNEKLYDKQAIIEGLRKNLSVTVIELADALRDLPEDHFCRKITFSDIFQMSSINTPDECLNELVKHKLLFHDNDKSKYLKIGEIQELIKCDRNVLTKTLNLLEMRGGMNGWCMITMGNRRGKSYSLKQVE